MITCTDQPFISFVRMNGRTRRENPKAKKITKKKDLREDTPNQWSLRNTRNKNSAQILCLHEHRRQ